MPARWCCYAQGSFEHTFPPKRLTGAKPAPMLEIQKKRLYEISRLRAHGASEEEVQASKNKGKLPFQPAFVNGKHKKRPSEPPLGSFEVPNAAASIRARQ